MRSCLPKRCFEGLSRRRVNTLAADGRPRLAPGEQRGNHHRPTRGPAKTRPRCNPRRARAGSRPLELCPTRQIRLETRCDECGTMLDLIEDVDDEIKLVIFMFGALPMIHDLREFSDVVYQPEGSFARLVGIPSTPSAIVLDRDCTILSEMVSGSKATLEEINKYAASSSPWMSGNQGPCSSLFWATAVFEGYWALFAFLQFAWLRQVRMRAHIRGWERRPVRLAIEAISTRLRRSSRVNRIAAWRGLSRSTTHFEKGGLKVAATGRTRPLGPVKPRDRQLFNRQFVFHRNNCRR